MKRMVAYPQLGAVLAVLLVAGVLLSLTQGPMTLPAQQSLLVVWDSLWGTGLNQLKVFQQAVVLELRLPRALLAIVTGALLSVCGAVTQGLFRNPLADPGVMGVSSGAGLGAALSIVLFPASVSAFLVPVAAFIGGLSVTILVYRLARTRAGTSVLVLLLAGVAIAAFSEAVIGFLTYIADNDDLRDLTLWRMGTLNGAKMLDVGLITVVCLLVLAIAVRSANALNAITLGEPEARHLGIDVERLKIRLILLVALGVGLAVATTGVIAFLGLIVPHLVRTLVGPDHRSLLPLSALMGAVLMLLADLGARLIIAPAEIPVGIMTAVFGAPFFTFLLLRQRRQMV